MLMLVRWCRWSSPPMVPWMVQMAKGHQVGFQSYLLSTLINSCSPAGPGEDDAIIGNVDAYEDAGMCFYSSTG